MKLKQICLIGLCGIILLSCARHNPLGQLFSPFVVKDKDKALVYIYRPLGEKMGYARKYTMSLNGEIILDLFHGGYHALEVPEGKVIIDVDPTIAGGNLLLHAVEAAQSKTTTLEFDAKKGDVYFARFSPIAHFTYFEPKISLVTGNDGLHEIEKCKVILKNN